MNKLLLTLPLLAITLLVLIIILQYPSHQESLTNAVCTLSPSSTFCSVTTCWNDVATIQMQHFPSSQERFYISKNSSQIYSTTVTLINGSTTFHYTNQNDTTFTAIYTFNRSNGTTYTATVNYVGNTIFVNNININTNGGYISTTGTTFTIKLSQGGTYLVTTSNGKSYTINGSGSLPIPVDQEVTYYVTPQQGQCRPLANSFIVQSFAKPTYIYITVSVS
jgi:hypothetical protein